MQSRLLRGTTKLAEQLRGLANSPDCTIWTRMNRRCCFALASALALCAPGRAATVQDFDFDGQGTVYTAKQTNNPPGPVLLGGGPSGRGRLLRLVSQGPQPGPPSSNTITFAMTDAAVPKVIVAEFDFLIRCGATRGDGFGFTLLNAAAYPTATVEPDHAPFAVEEPGYTGSVGVGFDIYANPAIGALPADIAHDGIRPHFSTSVSLHYDGKFLAQVDTVGVTDLANGQWKRARVIVRLERVTVQLAATRGQWVTLLDRKIAGLRPYAARAHFGGRCGNETSDVELDNVSVAFLQAGESVVSLDAPVSDAGEEVAEHTLTLTRTGDLSRVATVDFQTVEGGATPDVDYADTTGTVRFAAGQASAALRVPILDDAFSEPVQDFFVTLSNPTGGAVLGEARATVRLLDDETAAEEGRWSEPIGVGVSGVHAALLPNGRVLLFDRINNQRVWNPATLTSSKPSPPPGKANLFCSGHCFLPDGTLLVVGGHDDHDSDGHVRTPGGGAFDGRGLATAFRFLASTQTWSPVPLMNAGRWYPTATPLGDGSVLVVSGSTDRINNAYIHNALPEVWEPGRRQWRGLPDAEQQQLSAPFPKPQGVDLYPRMFLTPDGRALKIGADIGTWVLDPTGAGDWSEGPRRVQALRDYAAAVSYEPGKILYAGGGNYPPLAEAEVIDLNAATPEWRAVGSMAERRRQLNATTLPDGTVLVTGGSRNDGGDADGVSSPVLSAELWSPATEQWTRMDAMDIARLYHSMALLLPDGRVLAAGGGHSAAATCFHNEAEIYSPPYLFKGPRPTITSAPSVLTYGQSFLVQTPNAAGIASACLIRLAAVTHSFDQNALRIPLGLATRGAALVLTPPASKNVAPPGHYLLFVVNTAGVPSVARIVKIATDLPGGTFRALVSSSPATHEAAGLVQFVANAQGAFTATISFGGRTQVVRGAFDADGEFSATIPGSIPLEVQFSLDTSSGAPFLTGSLTQGGVTGAFAAARDFLPGNSAPAAGRYTVWLPHSTDPAAPQGHGYGALVVTAEGSARLAIRLGDDTAASFASTLPRGGSWPVFLSLHGGAGSVSGALTFRDVPGTSHVDGRLTWFRTGIFGTEVELLGSRYVAPRSGTRMLAFSAVSPTGAFQITGGNLVPSPADKAVSLRTDNRVVIQGSEPFSLTTARSSGLFTGTFRDPATLKTHAFRGAVIQEANFAAGLFLGTGATGSVELRPVP